MGRGGGGIMLFGWLEGDKEGLVEAESGRVIMIDETETRDAEMHVRVPLKINFPTKFEETRQDARIVIDRLVGPDGWTDKGLEDIVAAIVFEFVDREYRG
jgi:hypothetical protein